MQTVGWLIDWLGGANLNGLALAFSQAAPLMCDFCAWLCSKKLPLPTQQLYREPVPKAVIPLGDSGAKGLGCSGARAQRLSKPRWVSSQPCRRLSAPPSVFSILLCWPLTLGCPPGPASGWLFPWYTEMLQPSNNNKSTTTVGNWVLPPPLLHIKAVLADYKIIGKWGKYEFKLFTFYLDAALNFVTFSSLLYLNNIPVLFCTATEFCPWLYFQVGSITILWLDYSRIINNDPVLFMCIYTWAHSRLFYKGNSSQHAHWPSPQPCCSLRPIANRKNILQQV